MPVPPDWSQQLKEFVDKWKAAKEPAEKEQYLGDRPFHNFVLEERAGSWRDLMGWLDELQGPWCFRGQREAHWLLDTSLDRDLRKETPWGYYHLNRETEGRELLFRFQQRAHQYLPNLPSNDDLASWLALMQHHGVSTRLLDWTKSPYVALYFAVEEEPQGQEKSSAVWAIDLDWLERRGHEFLVSKGLAAAWDSPQARAESINGLLRHEEEQVIVHIDPPRIDERMAAQQGLFLCKLFHQAAFSLILMDMMIHPETPDRPVLRRLVVGSDLRIQFLKTLRAMNIHRASLFPGLDGFGRSLRLDLEIKVKEAEP